MGQLRGPRSITIGTGADCDVCLSDDPYVSDVHCVVTRDDDGTVWVADLGSTNGTFLRRSSGTRIETIRVTVPTRIEPGDVLFVGRTRLPVPPPRSRL